MYIVNEIFYRIFVEIEVNLEVNSVANAALTNDGFLLAASLRFLEMAK